MTEQDDVSADSSLDGIAIVGMSGRWPGAGSVAQFWENQLAGLEAISHFGIAELEIANRTEQAQNPGYVRARSILENIDKFDAAFFGIYPREALLMDPQQRLFLECCWEACEQGGYDPSAYQGAIGVYGGSSFPTYFLSRICKQPGFIDRFTGDYQAASFPELLGNGLDFLTTRVAYKLGLTGPSISMGTACSTSLVAVTQACQSLLTYQCDMALAGGASISLPQKRGTNFIEGGMTSPDGHCRAFDAEANGTVFGGGVAVVLLKRLDEALRDGDPVFAVIKGFAVNNDGSRKVGFTAPSVEGQARVVSQAHALSGVDPATIGYVEAHGTGTSLGDPIEVSALTQAFRIHTDQRQFCTLGTAKTNVGHLDAAAGATGLIHATLVVSNGVFPPTLHYRSPNPKLDLENSPFRVLPVRTDWQVSDGPRRAGVSAFGVGGTNAHVVIEQAPDRPVRAPITAPQALVLSARSDRALGDMRRNLAEYLRAHPEVDLADVAWTLQSGRRRFAHGLSVVASTTAEAVAGLQGSEPERTAERVLTGEEARVAFLFPGQGAQYVGMGRGLYDTEPVFRAAVDRCADKLRVLIGCDLRDVLFAANGSADLANARLRSTALAQPAIFTIEYALAELWKSHGIVPSVMVGHSVGEFAAACLAEVFSLDDALRLVAHRGRLMQAAEPGAMLSVRLGADELRARLRGTLAISAVNAPKVCVVGGGEGEIAALAEELTRAGVTCRRLVTSHAFHTPMMQPVVDSFRAVVASVPLSPPKVPIISSVTGKALSDAEAVAPDYWARHLREPVEFSAAIAGLRSSPGLTMLEVGPGNTLSVLALQHPGIEQTVTASLGGAGSSEPDAMVVVQSLAAMWLAGVTPDWSSVHRSSREDLRRVALPTYPFERESFWLAVPEPANPVAAGSIAVPVALPVRSTEPSTMQDIAAPALAAAPATIRAGDRSERIVASLIEIFEELSGTRIGLEGRAATFLDLGFDSLFLTQVTRALQNRIGLKVTFRQLLGNQNSLDALAKYADGVLPEGAFAEPVPLQPALSPVGPMADSAAAPLSLAVEGPPATTTLVPAVAPAAGIEQLMREQLQVMQQVFAAQIVAMRGVTSTAAASPAGVAAAPMPQAEPVVSRPQVTALAAASAPASTAATALVPFKSGGAAAPSDLTDHQRRHLDALIDRICRRSPVSKAQTESYRKVLADPRVVTGFRETWKEMVFPVVANRSKGSRIWDVDGNEYIDLLNGFGPIMFGHRPDFVEKALTEQVQAGFEIGPQSPLAGEIAELFCEITGNERVTFCNTGSEAVMAAMRLARTVTGRDKVLMFSGDYHGMFDEVLVKAGRTPAGEPRANAIAPGIPRESVANIVVLEYGTPETLEWIAKHAGSLAAVICEPVQSRRPDFRPIDFLKEVRRITSEAGTALVFDEVVTGFRAHPGGCQALFGIRADMATYGKVVGGGMPIGILAGRSEFMDALDGGQWRFGDDSAPEVGVTFFAGTFVRHPLALAAVKAVLLEIKAQGPALQERLTQRTQNLADRINAILDAHAIPTRVRSFASVMYFNFPPEERLASLFYYLLRENGVHALEGFPCFMTTAHTDADLDRIVAAFRTAAVEMQKGQFLASAAGNTTADAPAASPGVAKPSGPVPMTEPQREIFLAAMLDSAMSCAFNESFSVHFDGPLNVDALSGAFNDVVARHEALRSRIDPEGEHFHIDPTLVVALPLTDLTGLDEAVRQKALDDLLAEDALSPFDLFAGPLVRGRIVKTGPTRHSLIVTAHHIVCDGWSTNVILSELAELYSARLTGRSAVVPAAVSFSDYASERAGYVATADFAATQAFWLERFKDAPAIVDLPVDRPRGQERTTAGATLHHHVGVTRYKQIKSYGAKQGASLFATLLSAFNVLISRVAGAKEITIGLPLAGQALVDGGNLVGHCVNFLPMRTRVDTSLGFDRILADVKDSLLDIYDHQSYTYGTLVRELGVVRDPARLPLTEIQFNVEQIGQGVRFDALQVRFAPNPKGAVNFDMFVNVVESPDGLAIDCDYNTDLYDGATIAGWMNAFDELLETLSCRSGEALSALPLPVGTRVAGAAPVALSAAQLARLTAWNATTTAFPADRSIVELFEAQVRQAPNAVAVVYGETALTYDQLNRRSNQLARVILARGAEPEGLVAICLPRSLELIVATLAILKAGCGYVPLDATFPRDRLALMIGDTGAKVIVTATSVGLNLAGATNVLVDADAPAIDRENGTNPGVATSASGLAYVMYTSGSTGRPKGVMIEHRAVVRLVRDTNYCRFASDEVLLQNAPVSFDAATYEIWGALLNGAKLVVMPAGEPSLAELGRMIREHKVTQLFLTTGLFHLMVEQRLDDMRGLRTLMAGGEVLSAKHIQDVIDNLPDTRMIAIYGPTEGTTYSTFHAFEAGAIVPASVPIGKPLSNTRCYVLDDDQRPVAFGALGELCIAGDGLARGYLNNPELTAERFVTVGIGGGVRERLYRTGDLVRYLEDGTLEFHGRIDGQVKLRGYRIELGEIEAALQALPSIRQSCVLPVREDGRVVRLVAFVVPVQAGGGDGALLAQSLGSRLPAYMLPASFVEVDDLPLKVNGKIDRDKLLQIAAQKRGERRLEAADTPEELKLVAIVAEVMQLDRVGVTENLFEIGVDSLRVFQIASRAAKAGVSLTPRAIMKTRTIRAALKEMASSEATTHDSMEIKPVSRQRVRLPSNSPTSTATRVTTNDTRH